MRTPSWLLVAFLLALPASAVQHVEVDQLPGPHVDKPANRQIDPKQEEATDGDPVVLATGCFQMKKLDLSIPGRGANFAFIRTHRTGTTVKSALGPGWDFNWNKRIALPLRKILVPAYEGPGKAGGTGGLEAGTFQSTGSPIQGAFYYDGESRIDLFATHQFGSWHSAPGYFGKLISFGDAPIYHHNPDGSVTIIYRAPDSFELRNASGTVFTFGLRSSGSGYFGNDYHLTKLVDRDGNAFHLDYELIGTGSQARPRLKYVYDTLGRRIELVYGTNGRLASVEDFDGRAITFTYDAYGYLTEARSAIVPVEFPAGKTTKYVYSPYVSPHQQRTLLQVIAPSEAASNTPFLVNTYDGLNRVTKQVFGGNKLVGTDLIAAGGVYLFRYGVQVQHHPWFSEKSRTLCIDPNGNAKLSIFSDQGFERVSVQFSGRVDPTNLPDALSVNDIVEVTFGATSDLTTARLKTETVPTASYAAPLRSTDPAAFITTRDFNADGSVTEERGPGYKVVNVYTSPLEDVFQRGNVLRSERWPVPNDGTPPQVTITVYEPLYNRVRATIDARGNDATFTPPNGGTTSPGRYMNLQIFDYQEGDVLDPTNAVAQQAGKWGVSLAQPHVFAQLQTWWSSSALPLQPITASANLGDVNGDGAHSNGNVIESRAPTPQLFQDATSPGSGFQAAAPIVTKYTYNGFSLLTSVIDPAQGTTYFTYYPENRPSGVAGTETPDVTLAFPAGSIALDTVEGAAGGGFQKERIAPSITAQIVVVRRWYDRLGRLARERDPRGHESTTEHNALNQVARIVSPLGYETKWSYDANDNVVQRATSNRSPAFDAEFHPSGEVAFPDIVAQFSYDLLNRCVERRVQLDATTEQVTKFRYDRAGNPVLTLLPESSHDPANVTAAIFDERNLVWKASRGGVPAGFASIAAHGDIADPVITSASTSVSTTDYDLMENEVRVTDGENHVVQSLYDGFGRMRRQDRAIAGNYDELTYDPVNHVTSTSTYGDRGDGTQGLIGFTKNAHDELGRQYQRDVQLFAIATTGTPLDGALSPGDGFVTTRHVFDAKNRLTHVVDDNIRVTHWQYNAHDLPTVATDASGNEKRYLYDRALNTARIEETDRSSDGSITQTHFTWRFHDAHNRLIAEADNIGRVVRHAYDSRDNLRFTSDAEGPLTGALGDLDTYQDHRNAGGLPPLAVNGHGNTTIFEYDLASRPTVTTRHLRVGGTGAGALDATQSGDGMIRTTCEYDRNNYLTKQYDDNGASTTYVYDSLSRVKEVIFPDQRRRTTLYNRCDLSTHVTEPTGSVFVHQHDAQHRLRDVAITRGPGVVGTTQQAYEYDGFDRTVSTFDNNDPNDTNDDTTVTDRYNSLGHVQDRTQGIGARSWTTRRSYDGGGAVRSMVYPSGRFIRRGVDPIDRLQRITDGSFIVARYTYLGRERVQARMLATNSIALARTYDAARRVTTHEQYGPGSALLASFNYGYNRAGRQLYESGQHAAGAGDVWTYDSSYRLVNEKREVANPELESSSPGSGGSIGFVGTFTLDGAHNVKSLSENGTSWTNTIGPASEYVMFKSVAQQHDFGGNRIGNGSRTYAYDALNRLVDVRESGSLLATYRYTASGVRTQKLNAIGGGIVYVHANGNCLEERDQQTGALLRQYVHGRTLDEPLQIRSVSASGTVDSYYITNSHGSVVALTDSAGQVIERVRYSAYGQPTLLSPAGVPLAQQVSAVGNPLLFAGAHFDADTGLYYLRNRFYDPAQGRFLTRDPSGLWADSSALGNGYAYAGNDPVLRVDPWGLYSKKIHEKSTTEFLQSKGLSKDMAAVGGKANSNVDDKLGSQSAEQAHVHGMRPPGMTDAQAKKASEQVIQGHLVSSADALLRGDVHSAVTEFGEASHTAQDSESPWHRDPITKETIPWDGGTGKDIAHHMGEIGVKYKDVKATLDSVNSQLWNRLERQLGTALANEMGGGFRNAGYSAEQVQQAFQEAVDKTDAASKLLNVGTDKDGNPRSPQQIKAEIAKIKDEVKEEAKKILEKQEKLADVKGDTDSHGSVSGRDRDPNENVKGDCEHHGSVSRAKCATNDGK